MLHAVVDTRLQTKGQPIPSRVDRVDYLADVLGFERRDVEDGAENFALHVFDAGDLNQGGGHKRATAGQRQTVQHTAFGLGCIDIRDDAITRLGVDGRANIGAIGPRIADHQRVHGTRQHLGKPLGDVFLYVKAA